MLSFSCIHKLQVVSIYQQMKETIVTMLALTKEAQPFVGLLTVTVYYTYINR